MIVALIILFFLYLKQTILKSKVLYLGFLVNFIHYQILIFINFIYKLLILIKKRPQKRPQELDKESVFNEYKEWIINDYKKEPILFIREDPII